MAENNFQSTVESLFKGMDSFITTKTVVGDAITVGDTITLPLVDVSFAVGAGVSTTVVPSVCVKYFEISGSSKVLSNENSCDSVSNENLTTRLFVVSQT